MCFYIWLQQALVTACGALLAVAYNLYLSKLQEILEDREACMLQSTGSRRVGHNFFTEQQKQHANP